MWWEIPSRSGDRPSIFHQGATKEEAVEAAKRIVGYPDEYDWDLTRPIKGRFF